MIIEQVKLDPVSLLEDPSGELYERITYPNGAVVVSSYTVGGPSVVELGSVTIEDKVNYLYYKSMGAI